MIVAAQPDSCSFLERNTLRCTVMLLVRAFHSGLVMPLQVGRIRRRVNVEPACAKDGGGAR